MKILIISDEKTKYLSEYYNENNLENIKLILSAGDLPQEYLKIVKTNLQKPLYYVKGNHDTYKTVFYDSEFVEWKCVEYAGIRIAGIGCRKRNGQILSEREMEKKLEKLYRKIGAKGADIIISHYPALNCGDGDNVYHRGYKAIKSFIEKIGPKYFVYGHNHLNYGRNDRILKHENTVFVNAYERYILDIN